MNPPPPIPHDCGRTTESAKLVATAASTAFPPALRISSPARDAAAWSAATAPPAYTPRCASTDWGPDGPHDTTRAPIISTSVARSVVVKGSSNPPSVTRVPPAPFAPRPCPASPLPSSRPLSPGHSSRLCPLSPVPCPLSPVHFSRPLSTFPVPCPLFPSPVPPSPARRWWRIHSCPTHGCTPMMKGLLRFLALTFGISAGGDPTETKWAARRADDRPRAPNADSPRPTTPQAPPPRSGPHPPRPDR